MSVAMTKLPRLCLICDPARVPVGEGVVLMKRWVSSSDRVRCDLCSREQRKGVAGSRLAILKAADV